MTTPIVQRLRNAAAAIRDEREKGGQVTWKRYPRAARR